MNFEFLEKIFTIPRPSGHEEKIADYLVLFAQERKLNFHRDNINNVIIFKNNGARNTIILACHTDMVCVKDNDVIKDFLSQGIDWYVDGDFYKSKGTTLGVDNGVGIAMILSMLDSNEVGLPNIEAVFTVQEETTMNGASNLDYGNFKGKTLISLDGIKEGNLEVSCAGICNIECEKIIDFDNEKECYEIEISGLAGGHSGDDINKNRLSAIKLSANLLSKFPNVQLSTMDNGKVNNVIPNYAKAVFSSSYTIEQMNKVVNDLILKQKLIDEDKNLKIVIRKSKQQKVYTQIVTNDIMGFLCDFEQGTIVEFDDHFPKLSENLGIIKSQDNKLIFSISVRSADTNLEASQLTKLQNLAKKYNLKYTLIVKKPFYPYKENSFIRNLLAQTYKSLFNKEANIVKVHACMEIGLFAQGIKKVDMCVISPNVFDIHTTKERLSISSTEKTYDWLLKTLKEFDKK